MPPNVLAVGLDGTVTLQLKLFSILGPQTSSSPAVPSANLSRTQLSRSSRQALQLSHRLCADSQAPSGRRGSKRALEKGKSRAAGLFPPGAPGPGSVRLPRASEEAQVRSQPVVCALGLIFPQRQSSSGAWLLAWLQGTVIEFTATASNLHPSTLSGTGWGSNGSL